MIRHAASKATTAKFVQADALDLPMSDGTFDVVLLASLINVVPDRVKLLHEVQRVLKPGGKISVLFPTPAFTGEKAEEIVTNRNLDYFSSAAISFWASFGRKLTPSDVSGEIAAVGFGKPKIALLFDNNIASVTATKKTT